MQLFDNQVPLMKPWIEEDEWHALKEVLLSGWVSQGPKVQEFENSICNFVGAKYGVAMNACTSAMHIALKIAGTNYGDDVIVPNTTCMANVNAIKMAGANPIFVDIDRRTFNLNPELIIDSITPKTKAVMNIDQIGLPNDLDRLNEICQTKGIALLDDAATALGAKYKGTYLGGHGYMTTFSFHPRKMITTGEGGMLMTSDASIAENARILRATGASVSDLDRHKAKGLILQKYYESGYNYRLTDIQAAIGIVQMKKLRSMIEERTNQAEIYNNAFAQIDSLIIPFVPEYATPAWSSYCLTISPQSKLSVEEIISKMSGMNISVRYGIQPLHWEPYFEGLKLDDSQFPESVFVAKHTFFIPIFPGMTLDQQQYVIDSLNNILA